MKYYSVHFNRPDFIEIQKKFLVGDLIVINNHSNNDIQRTCEKLGLTFYNIENPYSNSYSHAHGLNFLKTIIDYSDDYCIIDHDLFPYKKIIFNENYDIITVKCMNNPNIPYLWPGFLAIKRHINIDDINFMPGLIENGDTGCDTNKLIKLLEKRIYFCKEKYIGEKMDIYIQKSPIVSQFDDYCIHYLNGSNWMKTNNEIINKKNLLLINLLKTLSIEK
jgi:hypothetical protein